MDIYKILFSKKRDDDKNIFSISKRREQSQISIFLDRELKTQDAREKVTLMKENAKRKSIHFAPFENIKTYSAFKTNVPNNWQENIKNPTAWFWDVRGSDLTGLDLRQYGSDFLYTADYDNRTLWPYKKLLPERFDPEQILEIAKNPGCGIKEIHSKGYNGSGQIITILDPQTLPLHDEYSPRIRHNESFGQDKNNEARRHSSAVVSLAIGKTCGIAPKAEVDFYSVNLTSKDKKKIDGTIKYVTEMLQKGNIHDEYIINKLQNYIIDLKNGVAGVTTGENVAKALKQLLENNKKLPEEQKSHIVSMSAALEPLYFDDAKKMIEQAKKEDVFVITTSLLQTHGLKYLAGGRNLHENLDASTNCTKGAHWSRGGISEKEGENALIFPVDQSAWAAPTGKDDYAKETVCGDSWVIPKIAGAYAIARQIDSKISPEKFWQLSLNSATPQYDKNGKCWGKLISYPQLVEFVKKYKGKDIKITCVEISKQNKHN